MPLKRTVLFFLVASTVAFSQEKKIWTLQEMVDYAAQNNLTIKSIDYNNQLLDNNITEAKRQRLPSVNGSFNNSLVIGGGDIPYTDRNGSTNGYMLYQNSLGVNSSMTLYNRGRFNLNEEKAQLDYESGKFNIENTINDISLQIVNYYLTLMLNKEIAAVSKEQLNLSELQLEQSKKLYDGGAIPLSQVYEAEAAVSQDQSNYTTAIIEIDQARFNLAQLLQLPDYTKFDAEIVPIPEEIPAPLYDVESILEYATQNQPNVKKAEVDIESAEKNIDIARTNYWPTITGSYSFGTNYRDYLNNNVSSDALLTQWWDNNAHTFSVNVDIPIFNKFLTDLNVENAEIEVARTQNSLAIEKQNLREDVQLAYFQVNASYERYLATKEAVRSAQLSLDFSQKGYDAGKVTIYDLNQARNTLFSAKSKVLQAKYNYLFQVKVLDFYAGEPLTF